ncbi:hypothetical protein GDO81_011555 [Engystomops pustulosus]|uniref:Uncharacterized protein n=1 Tax=Engystomops pustulosus TaxID=76066 RepID=A0AAV7BFF4_ENGPU|nr:hypothetical protein GDO81_011555 [Engystomops pustulosus]
MNGFCTGYTKDILGRIYSVKTTPIISNLQCIERKKYALPVCYRMALLRITTGSSCMGHTWCVKQQHEFPIYTRYNFLVGCNYCGYLPYLLTCLESVLLTLNNLYLHHFINNIKSYVLVSVSPIVL